MADLQGVTSKLSSSTSFYNFNALKLLIVPVSPAVLKWQKILVGVFPSNQLLNRFFEIIFQKSLKYGMAGELVSFNTRQLSDIY